MIRLVKDIFKPLYLFTTSKTHRQYYKLFSKYASTPRFEKRTVSFLSYSITVVDALSFLYQFKEIFLEETYKFDAVGSNPVIYDCGANIGVSCLYFKSLFPGCTIKAFEADPDVFEVLKSNVSQIDDGSIELFHAAVWINNDGVEFSQEGADGGAVAPNRAVRTTKVPSVRLRDLLLKDKIDFLKIDIEGAEMDVLMDCDGALQQVRLLFFEYHSHRNQRQQLDQLLMMLSKNNFRYFIQSPTQINAPFTQQGGHPTMDLQLNVYCFRR